MSDIDDIDPLPPFIVVRGGYMLRADHYDESRRMFSIELRIIRVEPPGNVVVGVASYNLARGSLRMSPQARSLILEETRVALRDATRAAFAAHMCPGCETHGPHNQDERLHANLPMCRVCGELLDNEPKPSRRFSVGMEIAPTRGMFMSDFGSVGAMLDAEGTNWPEEEVLAVKRLRVTGNHALVVGNITWRITRME